MHKIPYQPKFCSLERKIGQLQRRQSWKKKTVLEKFVLFFNEVDKGQSIPLAQVPAFSIFKISV